MEKAIVLVSLAPGSDEQSVSSIRKVPGILSVYQLYGLYDLLVSVEGADEQAVKGVIADNLRANPGVVSTITMKVLQ